MRRDREQGVKLSVSLRFCLNVLRLQCPMHAIEN
jgi:hypothetical protein